MNFVSTIVFALIACATSAVLVILLKPLLERYALALPNPRSSHKAPTAQGGGIAVMMATVATVFLATQFFGIAADPALLAVFMAAIFIAFVGAFDDLRSIAVLPRLCLQTISVATVLASLPSDFHLFSVIPVWVERTVLLIAGLWFINLVNFMDGIDWITVAEIVPITGALAIFGFYGQLPPAPAFVAAVLGGAMLGFAPFNRPVAKLFLGDVGSLSIGLLTGWCLLQLAGAGHFAASLLLPLYYLADATVTLVIRLIKGNDVRIAHRSHFYQRATDNGFTVMQVVAEIFVLNLVLTALAALSIFVKAAYAGPATVVVGAIAVAFVLRRFSHPRVARGWF